MDRVRTEVVSSDDKVRRVVAFAELGTKVVKGAIFDVVPTWTFALDGFRGLSVEAAETRRGFRLTVDTVPSLKDVDEVRLLEIALSDKTHEFIKEIRRIETLARDIQTTTKLYDLRPEPLLKLATQVSDLEALAEAQAIEGQEPDDAFDLGDQSSSSSLDSESSDEDQGGRYIVVETIEFPWYTRLIDEFNNIGSGFLGGVLVGLGVLITLALTGVI